MVVPITLMVPPISAVILTTLKWRSEFRMNSAKNAEYLCCQFFYVDVLVLRSSGCKVLNVTLLLMDIEVESSARKHPIKQRF
jgi:hypothetical protein